MNTLDSIQKHLNTHAAWFDLQEQGVIKVTGADRLSFLNGQLTQDMTTLTGNNALLCAYCNPKGRVIALFRALNTDEALYLVTERALIADVIMRLQKFIFRAKAVFEDVSKAWSVLGVSDIAAATESTAFPREVNQYNRKNGAFFLRMPSAVAAVCRGMVVIPSDIPPASFIRLSQGHESLWNSLDIAEGWPRITQNSREKFLTQSLNLEALEGVSFTKGCYVGQEIIARMHYLGKSKQSMAWGITQAKGINSGDVLRNTADEKVAEVIFVQTYEGETLMQLAVTGEPHNQTMGLQQGHEVRIIAYPL